MHSSRGHRGDARRARQRPACGPGRAARASTSLPCSARAASRATATATALPTRWRRAYRPARLADPGRQHGGGEPGRPARLRDERLVAAVDGEGERACAQASGLEIPIVVGRGAAAVKTLNDRGAIKLADLAPGQGLIAAVRAPLGGGDGLVIVGGDDKGTLAAANEVAARLPRMWSMSGVTLSGVAEQVARYLAKNGVDVARRDHVDRRGQRSPRVGGGDGACRGGGGGRGQGAEGRSRIWIACIGAVSSRRCSTSRRSGRPASSCGPTAGSGGVGGGHARGPQRPVADAADRSQ